MNIYNATTEGIAIFGIPSIKLDLLHEKAGDTEKNFSIKEYWSKIIEQDAYHTRPQKLLDFLPVCNANQLGYKSIGKISIFAKHWKAL